MSAAKETLLVNQYVNGVLNPALDMLGPLKDGGHIIAHTTPGCWRPMITPCIRGGHEVTRPVYAEGAEPGDAIAIRIKTIEVISLALLPAMISRLKAVLSGICTRRSSSCFFYRHWTNVE